MMPLAVHSKELSPSLFGTTGGLQGMDKIPQKAHDGAFLKIEYKKSQPHTLTGLSWN